MKSWISERNKERFRTVLVHVVLILGVVIFTLPFAWLLSTSLKTSQQLRFYNSIKEMLIPNPVQWSNYPEALKYIDFWRAFFNSSYITVMAVIGSILSCPLVAFSFSRLRWPGRDTAFIILLSTMMLPAQVTMIPLFLIYTRLGWVDTLRPLYVPAFLATPFFVFLLRQFFLTIPRELEDAAKIDGCSYFGIYWKVMLPLIKPALASVVIFQVMWSWNDFLQPLIYIHTRSLMPLSLAIQAFAGIHDAEWTLLMAAATLMSIPIAVIFLTAQRYFIEGITLTGLKG